MGASLDAVLDVRESVFVDNIRLLLFAILHEIVRSFSSVSLSWKNCLSSRGGGEVSRLDKYGFFRSC